MPKPKIGLIACQKKLPVVLHEHLIQKGYDVVVINFKEVHSLLKPNFSASLGQIGKIFRFLKKNQIQEIILAGAISRPDLWKLRFDWTGLGLALSIIPYLKKGDDALLRFVCGYIQKQGIKLRSISEICPELLMPHGVMSKNRPSQEQQRSIIFGCKLLNHLSAFDIGQSVAVSGEVVVGIETLEGTDRMIHHIGLIETARLGGLSKPVLIKIRKLKQSNLVDLPTIGIDTINSIIKAGFSGIALEAGGCILLDYDHVISLVNQHNLFLIGIKNDFHADKQEL